MGFYKIEGVVLRRRNLGEADRLVTVLTRDRGKITIVARGARRPRSRLGGRLEPSTRMRALVAEGRTLDVISQVEVVEANAALRRDLERVGVTSVVLEMADRALADRHPHPDVYRLVLTALGLAREGSVAVVWPWFAARLLVLLGHRPSVTRCLVCGRRLRDPAVWSTTLGGCLHAACRARDSRAIAMSSGARALLAFLLDARPTALGRVAPAPSDLAVACDILRGYAEACWETRLRAPGVVELVTRPPGRASSTEPGASGRGSERAARVV
jgi:DNA repair protein RecO (recombination protein O)